LLHVRAIILHGPERDHTGLVALYGVPVQTPCRAITPIGSVSKLEFHTFKENGMFLSKKSEQNGVTMSNGSMIKVIELLEAMAKEGGTTVDKAITMVKVYERNRMEAQAERRSTPDEKTFIQTEMAKLDAAFLRASTSKEIAGKLLENSNGVTIRPKVQGVVSIISRTRRQLLLTYDNKQHQQPTV
jgi:hypothetical protein